MARTKTNNAQKANGNGAALGFEAKLWLAADKLRNNLEKKDMQRALGRTLAVDCECHP